MACLGRMRCLPGDERCVRPDRRSPTRLGTLGLVRDDSAATASGIRRELRTTADSLQGRDASELAGTCGRYVVAALLRTDWFRVVGRPNRAAFSGVSGVSRLVPSIAISRSPNRNAPGVSVVATGPANRRNSRTSGRDPAAWRA